MGHQTATLEDTVYFWFASNDTSGSGGDGATPLFDVREAGAAASAAPLLSGTPDLLTHVNFPAGCHEIAVAATAANGFAANDTFAVFCTLLVDSQNPSGFVGSCTLTPLAKAAALATAQTDLDTITDSDGVILGAAGVDLVWDEVLTGATHNVTNSSGRRLRQIDAAFEVHSGTAQAGAATTITLDTGASASDDIYRGDRIVIVGGTGQGEHGICTAYNGTTKVATMAETWIVTPDATSEFEVVPASVDIETWQHNVVTGDGDWAAIVAALGTVDTVVDAIKAVTDLFASGPVLVKTTIATLASQVSFTLTAGSADDSAYQDCLAVIEDVSTATQKAVAPISAYTGATKTITLDFDPAVFTMATTDIITILAASKPTQASANKVADSTWRRTYANIRASSDGDTVTFRSALGMVSKLVNKWSIAAGVLTLTHEDDTTTFGTQNLTTDAAADPITTVDTV